VTGESYGVCAAASECCVMNGGGCTETGQCCASGPEIGPLGQVCISNDGLCHPLCTSSSQCGSNCCIQIEGESYGDCGAYQSGYTCL
jgi:hypothetical protein